MRASLFGLWMVFSGCSLVGFDDHDFTPTPPPCSVPAVTDLSGSWTLDATGHRSGCIDGTYAGEFRLENATLLDVVQGKGGDAGVAGELSLANPPSGFSLTGSLRGSCLEFEARELVNGETIRYVFEATVDEGARTAAGELRGSGPSQCVIDGTFDLIVRP